MGVNDGVARLVGKGNPPRLPRPVALCSNTLIMTLPADPAAKLQDAAAARLRDIPSVDEIMQRPHLRALAETAGREIVLRAARNALSELRAQLQDKTAHPEAKFDMGVVEARIARDAERILAPSLKRVINATGVILHTNLGRAPLPAASVQRIAETAGHYTNLEYDLASGRRGRRDVHTAQMLAEMVGAEAAIVVNNNAAAVFLVLHTLAKGAEVIVSRGELIEIGDGFRIPEIMAESGAILREVGTTNRTRLRDFERAINPQTRLLLRVHPSNFRITGFTERPSLDELVSLGRRSGLPVFEDLGSGCLADFSSSGIQEPLARASCQAGASIVTFSGDKLLGGPQAGIIAGEKEIVERVRRNPLFRALRVDKLAIAALEATLLAYLRGAQDEIPVLRMIRWPCEEIARRAAALATQLRASLPKDVTVELRPGFSVVGGGSTPDQQLPTELIAIASQRHSAARLEERLRKTASGVPVVARIEEDRLVLDLRTVFPEEESALLAAIVSAQL